MIFFTDLVKICDEVLCNCQLELPLLARDWGHSGAGDIAAPNTKEETPIYIYRF